ncbi:hypothetical protein AVEN_196542-1 [Araneus ventricosus]|uniref:Uncharacterized protein n=1 Tax=Araneus ventricosus TaxID=182803 RepID=A0A4Y2UMT8_ARAVE|nr:hypothetical protein AVEN_196542-1 [Araneus ventricosus]
MSWAPTTTPGHITAPRADITPDQFGLDVIGKGRGRPGLNSNFTCGDPTILSYELIYSRNRGTVGHNVRLPRVWQVLDVYASRLITLTPPEYGAPCETLLSVHFFHTAINL